MSQFEKIKVGTVSYLNAKPLIYGFENGMMADQIDLIADYPSSIASQLLEKKIDIGLVPVAIIPQMKEYHIIGNYCIGAVGEVASVCLFSDAPVHEIETIILDYQSRTSVALLKLLLKDHWKINPAFIDGVPGYEKEISGTTAGLVIGDRAMLQRKNSPYVYDLSDAWMEMTGLPFVFAVWLSNKPLSDDFIAEFDKANQLGFENLDEIITKFSDSGYDLHEYYTKYISYRLDEDKKKGLNQFLKLIS
jgi:chorismate dehydratase